MFNAKTDWEQETQGVRYGWQMELENEMKSISIQLNHISLLKVLVFFSFDSSLTLNWHKQYNTITVLLLQFIFKIFAKMETFKNNFVIKKESGYFENIWELNQGPTGI